MRLKIGEEECELGSTSLFCRFNSEGKHERVSLLISCKEYPCRYNLSTYSAMVESYKPGRFTNYAKITPSPKTHMLEYVELSVEGAVFLPEFAAEIYLTVPAHRYSQEGKILALLHPQNESFYVLFFNFNRELVPHLHFTYGSQEPIIHAVTEANLLLKDEVWVILEPNYANVGDNHLYLSM